MVWGLGFLVLGLGFWVWGLGFLVLGFGFRVLGMGFWVCAFLPSHGTCSSIAVPIYLGGPRTVVCGLGFTASRAPSGVKVLGI